MISKHSLGRRTRPTVLMGLCMVITVMSISSISMVAMGSRRVIMGSTTCGRVISRVLVRVLRGCAVIAVIAVITSRVMAALMTSSTELSCLHNVCRSVDGSKKKAACMTRHHHRAL